jgi:hypothetical protein
MVSKDRNQDQISLMHNFPSSGKLDKDSQEEEGQDLWENP